jgi:hypothetical protein
MADKANQTPPVVDPDSVPETLCDGPFNIQWGGNRGIITFTHPRAKAGPLFAKGEVDYELVVRARVATSVNALVNLRDLLNHLFPADKPLDKAAASGGGAATKLH